MLEREDEVVGRAGARADDEPLAAGLGDSERADVRERDCGVSKVIGYVAFMMKSGDALSDSHTATSEKGPNLPSRTWTQLKLAMLGMSSFVLLPVNQSRMVTAVSANASKAHGWRCSARQRSGSAARAGRTPSGG